MRTQLLILLAGLSACRGKPPVELTAEPVRVDPQVLAFGDAFVGYEAQAEVGLTNPNKTPLAVDVKVDGPFELPARSVTLEGGVALRLKLTFRPPLPGAAAGTLTVNGVEVGLTGTGVAVPDCGAVPVCQSVAFDPVAGRCVVTALAEGALCTSSFACFTRAECHQAQCVGVLSACDDGDRCTTDTCGAGGCAHSAPITCPKLADPCQRPFCLPAVGCTSEAVADGTACGAADCVRARICLNGACVSRPVPQTPACTAWEQEGYLKAFNTGAGDAFGNAVAISADGTTLAVSAWGEDAVSRTAPGNNSVFESGAVYVYAKQGLDWQQVAFLKASNPGASDRFGAALALSADGATLVVGADSEDSSATTIDGNQASNAAPNAGAAYVFTRGPAGWAQQAYLKGPGTQAGDALGAAVAISASGTTVAAGAPGRSQVVLFERNASQTWTVGATVTAPAGEGFGAAVAIAGDGKTLVAGVPHFQAEAGGVRVFRRAASWVEEPAVLTAPLPGAALGTSVALSFDGATLAAGAPAQSGVVGVFDFAAGWARTAILQTGNTHSSDGLGASVAISSDGATVLSGDPTAAAGGANAGAAFVFHRAAGAWAQVKALQASNRGADDRFGGAAALSGDGLTAVVGAVGESSAATTVDGDQADDTAVSAGAAYVF